MRKEFIKGTIIFTAASALVISANFLFYFIGRYLSPEEFGVLASAISVLYIILIPEAIIKTIVTRVVAAEKKAQSRAFATYIYKKVSLVLIAFLLLYAVLFIPLKNFLHLESVLPLVLVGTVALYIFFRAIELGILTGRKKFAKASSIGIIEAVGKLLLGFGLVLLGFGVIGALVGIVIAGVISYLLSLFLARSYDTKNGIQFKKLFNKELIISVTVSIVVLNILIAVDVLIAKNKLSQLDAGLYSAVSTFGKLAFFGTSGIVTALFPLTSQKAKGSIKKKMFLLSSAFVALISAVVILIYVFFDEQLILLVFGDKYIGAGSFLWIGALAFSFYSIINLSIQYLISRSRYKFVAAASLPVVLIIIFSMLRYTTDISSLIYSFVYSTGVAALFLFIYSTTLKDEK
ncbi:MAG TPA: hypothetical protein ENI23_04720 [bacterium]|nr:hypothetical protein [bacterium]